MAIKGKSNYGGAFLVALGILLSRISGLLRMRAIAHFLGNSTAADAYYAAIKIPNFLQNLLGEGVLSASFIPVYANLLAKGNHKLAQEVAGVVLSLLSLLTSILVAVGIVATPFIIDLVAPGFTGETKQLTITLVQILFPGIGLLVISAWCLGILNSHHKFFLSYASPVISNLAVIAILYFFRNETNQSEVAKIATWGLVVGSVLQVLVQVPSIIKLTKKIPISLNIKLAEVKTILKNFFPVLTSRGVVQLSGYIDSMLASYLPIGAVSALGYAQSIYMLPISLFGMSISAAELPSMSKDFGNTDFYEKLCTRLNNSLRKIAFFVIPSVAMFIFLGDKVVFILFQSGKFDSESTLYVWKILVGSGLGLLASTMGRLYSSAFYSLRDTKTPLRFSMIRVILTTALGYYMGLVLPKQLGITETWGAAGLTASAGIAGWVEFYLLRKNLNKQIGKTNIPLNYILKLWGSSIFAGLIVTGVRFLVGTSMHEAISAIILLTLFGAMYLSIAIGLKVPEALSFAGKIAKRPR